MCSVVRGICEVETWRSGGKGGCNQDVKSWVVISLYIFLCLIHHDFYSYQICDMATFVAHNYTCEQKFRREIIVF